jgi:outer membrane lipoprotein SlyB
MRIYSLEAPDGNTYDLQAPEGASEQELTATLYALKPEAAQPFVKESGVFAGVKKGIEQLVSGAQTATGVATGDANEAAKAALARNKAMDKKYEDQVSFQKVLDAYKNNGLLSGAGEAVSQIPLAIAEQAPNLAATFAGAKIGAKTGSTLGAVGGARGRVLGGIAGGIAGAFTPSYGQALAGNVERQAQEQEAAGQPIDINTGKAATTAIPQAALDVVGDRILLGGKLFGKMIGIPEKVLFKDGLETAEKLAKERFLTTLAKGTATGAAGEIPTEVAQQALERYQAGLSLTSPDALREYGDTAYQVGLLGPLGAAGRFAEKSGAKAQVQQKAYEDQQIADAEAQKVAQQAAPVQAQDIATRYQEAEKRKANLKSQIRKVEEGSVTETADRLYNKELEEQIKGMTPELEQLAAEYNLKLLQKRVNLLGL